MFQPTKLLSTRTFIPIRGPRRLAMLSACLLCVCLAWSFVIEKAYAKSNTPQRMHAKATIAVKKYEPADYDSPSAGPKLVRIRVEEHFSGDIDGDGVVTFLQAARADGSASFVGIERVTGAIGGKHGTFLLQDSGTVAGNVVSGKWFVVPASGTGALKSLRGTGGFRANLGEGAAVTLDYWFE